MNFLTKWNNQICGKATNRFDYFKKTQGWTAKKPNEDNYYIGEAKTCENLTTDKLILQIQKPNSSLNRNVLFLGYRY